MTDLDRNGASARILVVDDEPDVLGYLEAVLQRAGYEVDAVSDLAEARKCLAGAAHDALVTDLDLPDGDGLSLIPLAAVSPVPIRVIVVTAHTDYDKAVQALHDGAYDFIAKPANKDALLSAVRRAVEARRLETDHANLLRELEARVLVRTSELSRSNDRLGELNRRLEMAKDQMVRTEKMASLGCIAAGVAHEINNPIGFINSNLQTLKRYFADLAPFIRDLRAMAPPDSELQEAARKMDLDFLLGDIEDLVRESEDGVQRVVNIVRDLKTFSKGQKVGAELADLNECVEAARSLARNETRHVAEVVFAPSPLPKIRAWPVEITQVLLNLIVNAAHAVRDRPGERDRTPTIEIRTRSEAGNVFLEVEDTGCGIPDELLPRIFDPFFTTRQPGEGTGLGLSLSYEIVKRHGGEIHVSSGAGRGTTITVRIPETVSIENEATT